MGAGAVLLASLLLAPPVDSRDQQPAAAPPGAPQGPAASAPRAAPAVLPEWIHIGIEHRGRLEGPMNIGFNGTWHDSYWLNRFRIDARAEASRLLAVQVQAQDAQVFGRNPKPDGPPFEDTIDLRMAFADIGRAGPGPAALRVGRQELAFGDQRLVGHVSWANTARTFDAARVTLARKGYRADAFAASPVAARDGDFNRSGHGEAFYGVYVALASILPSASVEPYVFLRTLRGVTAETGESGRLRSATAGARIAGRLPARFDYNAELALQRGSASADDVRAWAGHWAVGRTIVPAAALRVFGEYNYASGDRGPSDGTRGTFDQLYPTPHDKYGLADQVGWRNVHHARAGIELRPFRRVAVAGGYHSWWRASTSDGVYAASGTVLAGPVAGVPDRHIGQEVDIQATGTVTPRVLVHAGYARIVSGRFLQRATPGKGYSFPYLMVTSVILKGDR